MFCLMLKSWFGAVIIVIIAFRVAVQNPSSLSWHYYNANESKSTEQCMGSILHLQRLN